MQMKRKRRSPHHTSCQYLIKSKEVYGIVQFVSGSHLYIKFKRSSSKIEDDGYENRNNHITRQYAITGGATGLGMYLLGPSALSLPVPLLCYLCNDSNSINNHAGQISPQEAFDSLIAGAVPYLLSNILWFHRFGARPRLTLFLPFAIGLGAVYGMEQTLLLPHMPDYMANAGFGLLALAGGGLKLGGSIRGLKKLL